MILVHPRFERALVDGKSGGFLLVLENPGTMRSVISDFKQEVEEKRGILRLFDEKRSLSFEKNVQIIFSPFILEHNPRKAITQLYRQLNEELINSEEEYRLQELIGELRMSLLKALPQSYTELADPEEPDWDAVLNFFDISFKENFASLLEKISAYCRSMHHYLGFKLFICLNLLSVLSVEELALLYNDAKYNEYIILNLESSWPEGTPCPAEQKIVMDQDDCEL